MSNTAEVTPYENDQTSVPGEAAGALAAASVGVIALAGLAAVAAASASARAASKVLAENDDERAAKERRAQARSEELLKAARPCELRLPRRSAETLVLAAQKLGYRLTAAPAGRDRRLTLSSPSGAELALSPSAGGVTVSSNVGREAAHAVVRQDTLDRALAYLTTVSGAEVQVSHGKDGTVELRAKERDRQQPDGKAQITARISRQGIAHVDIEGLRGTRCEKVLKDFATAVGGRAKNKRIKPDYYRSKPGEPARVKAGK